MTKSSLKHVSLKPSRFLKSWNIISVGGDDRPQLIVKSEEVIQHMPDKGLHKSQINFMHYERSDAELWCKHGCLSNLDRFTQLKTLHFYPEYLIALKWLHLLLRPHKPDFSPCSTTSTSVKRRRQRPSLDYINEDRPKKQLVLTQQLIWIPCPD